MKIKNRNLFWPLINLVGFLATVVVNALANALPINNKTTGELSDQYPNLFVPAGLTFSIWGLIYILLAIFVVYNFIVAFNKNTNNFTPFERIGFLYFIASILNIGWILAWHYELVSISLVFMLLLFGSLLSIYLKLSVGNKDKSNKEKYMVHLPFSIYLGWITIATIANVTALLVNIGWNRFGLSEEFWTILVIVVGVVIATCMLIRRQDIFYCLVIIWALLGIALKRLNDVTPLHNILITVYIGLAILNIGIIVQIVRKRVYSVSS